jgi:hypothetical protein
VGAGRRDLLSSVRRARYAGRGYRQLGWQWRSDEQTGLWLGGVHEPLDLSLSEIFAARDRQLLHLLRFEPRREGVSFSWKWHSRHWCRDRDASTQGERASEST